MCRAASSSRLAWSRASPAPEPATSRRAGKSVLAVADRVRTEPLAVERRPGDSMCPAARVFLEEPDLCAGRGLVVAALLLLHAFDDGESELDGSHGSGDGDHTRAYRKHGRSRR